jgi:hypothetical protein
VRYGGFNAPGQLTIKGGVLNFTTGKSQESANAGIRIETSDPVIANVEFLNNRGAALSMDLASNPAISGNNPVVATGNGINGLVLDGGTLPEDGIWNDPDIVYVTNGEITVPAGNKLTVGPGQVVKFGHFSYNLLVAGILDAQGTPAAPITFTELRDDSAGGDTNNNGDTSGPGPKSPAVPRRSRDHRLRDPRHPASRLATVRT